MPFITQGHNDPQLPTTPVPPPPPSPPLSTRSVAEPVPPASKLPLILGGVALVLALAGLGWAITLQSSLNKTQGDLAAEVKQLRQHQQQADARSQATSEALAQRLGTTQAALDAKAQAIMRQQNLEAARRETEEAKINENVSAVKTDVGAVKTDVGAVKTDLGSTKTDVGAVKTDLADTKSQLQRTIGDAGVMSGLIARNSTELEELKHKGDRSYYEFTLQKNAPPTLLSSIKLQLKKVDQKKGKFTLQVNADDRVIEKKDKTLDEPVQFYSGKTPALFEIVVNNVDKNQVKGYLSVPKGQ